MHERHYSASIQNHCQYRASIVPHRYKHTLNQAILLKLYAFLTVQVDPVELLAIYAKDASFIAASGKPGFPELVVSFVLIVL